MDKIYPNRIRELRKAKGLTIEELAAAAGFSVPYVGRLEKGERNLSVKNINLLALALGATPSELLAAPEPNRRNVVSVMGRIGAGAEILPDDEQIPHDGLYEIETPFPLPEDAIAFEINGDSMWPRYDEGDIIICWRHSDSPESVAGWEAAVKTEDGKRYLKRVLNGSTPGTYDLESHNAPPIRGVRLTWVAAIQSVIRSGQWHKLAVSSRTHLTQRMLGK